MTTPVLDRLKAARESGLSGDVAAGALAALIIGLPLHLHGPGGAVMGVPMSVVWAGVAGVAVAMGSMALLTDADRND